MSLDAVPLISKGILATQLFLWISATGGFNELTAAWTLILPFPWIILSSPISTAEFFKAIFISPGVQSGWACFIKATAPETTGVAMLVPAIWTCSSLMQGL